MRAQNEAATTGASGCDQALDSDVAIASTAEQSLDSCALAAHAAEPKQGRGIEQRTEDWLRRQTERELRQLLHAKMKAMEGSLETTEHGADVHESEEDTREEESVRSWQALAEGSLVPGVHAKGEAIAEDKPQEVDCHSQPCVLIYRILNVPPCGSQRT